MKHIVKITTMSVFDTHDEAVKYVRDHRFGKKPEPNVSNVDYEFILADNVGLLTENNEKPTISNYVEIPD